MKLCKFYILLTCTALCMLGCGQKPVVSEAEEVPAQETVEEPAQEEEETPKAEAESEEEKLEEERLNAEKQYHPIKKGAVDYLSVKGITVDPKTEIAMVATDSENKFWNTVKKGAQKAVSDLNEALGYTGKNKISLTFTAPKKENVADQINIIDQFLDKAPNALCIAFTDATACKTQMQMAKNNGIHLIAFDTPDEGEMTEALVATDNKAASAESAGKLFEAIGYEGKVAIIVHNSLTQTGKDRKQAIVDELANSYNDKDIQFVDIVYLAQEDRSSTEILDELLEKNPDLAGIICTDLKTTEMVIDYTKKQEEQSYLIAGFDSSEKIVNAIEDGTLIGSMSQDPFAMGYATITTAARSIAGAAKTSNVHSAHQWIDASNLQTEEVQSILNY